VGGKDNIKIEEVMTRGCETVGVDKMPHLNKLKLPIGS
jgi:hypothetical protein